MNPVEYSLALGQSILNARSRAERKSLGQFLTPASSARYMASQFSPGSGEITVLDPALGSGTLACAAIEHLSYQPDIRKLTVVGYEIDPDLLGAARLSLQAAIDQATRQGVKVSVEIRDEDFISAHSSVFAEPTLFDPVPVKPSYDFIISNPPYFKLSADDPRRVSHLHHTGTSHTNIYSLFMDISLTLLNPNGKACFLVPRSFCSGTYFAPFRRKLFSESRIDHIHLFDSRSDAFRHEDILQESMIITYQTRSSQNDKVDIIELTQSDGEMTALSQPESREVSTFLFVGEPEKAFYYRLPLDEVDDLILRIFDSWPERLESFGLAVSTGPVVPFRARDYLRHQPFQAVPLYWLINVQRHQVTWPISKDKPQWISQQAAEENLLLPAQNYVFVRRFSAKEDARRLVAAPFDSEDSDLTTDQVGIENHLNYIYRRSGTLSIGEVFGISALLNSTLYDRYIRLISGNTQVNATELRLLPLPPASAIHEIGEVLLTQPEIDLDQVVYRVLKTQKLIPEALPVLEESRLSWAKSQKLRTY